MKRTLITIIASLFILTVKAQTNDTTKSKAENEDKIYTSVEQMPQFPGGIEKFYYYLMTMVRYPATARDHNKQGKVVISMIIEKDGSLSHVQVARSVSEDLDNEALRVMKLCPNWNPGMQNGKAVRVAYTVPLSFTLSK